MLQNGNEKMVAVQCISRDLAKANQSYIVFESEEAAIIFESKSYVTIYHGTRSSSLATVKH